MTKLSTRSEPDILAQCVNLCLKRQRTIPEPIDAVLVYVVTRRGDVAYEMKNSIGLNHHECIGLMSAAINRMVTRAEEIGAAKVGRMEPWK